MIATREQMSAEALGPRIEQAVQQRLEAAERARQQQADEAERARLATEQVMQAEQARLTEETRQAEQARLAEEARLAEQARLAEEARQAEQADDQGSEPSQAIALVALRAQEQQIRDLTEAVANDRLALNSAQAKYRALERVRDRTAQVTRELRQAFENAQLHVAEMNQRLEGIARRYVALYDDPSMTMKFKLRRRLRMALAKFGIGSMDGRAFFETEMLRRSIYFDRGWYVEAYPEVAASGLDPVEHYLRIGGREGKEPGPWFSGENYLHVNPDVKAAGVNPLLHYLEYGRREGRAGGPLSTKAKLGGLAPPKAASRDGVLFVSGEPESAGHNYRIQRYLNAARDNGQQAHWVRSDDLTSEVLSNARSFGCVVVWRAPWSVDLASLVERMRGNGARIVFDVDDLMIDPALAEVKVIDGIRSQAMSTAGVAKHFELVRETMLNSDVCYTTTEELAYHMRKAGKVVHVLPNGFDQATYEKSRLAARRWAETRGDDLIRIGYAGGTRTHQRDFGVAVAAIARILRESAKCRLVLFKDPAGSPKVDVNEFPELNELLDRIEWRDSCALDQLPFEMARFDVNIAPLEFGNPFCEAKSELKFFEAALVGAPTIASPTGPFRRAIQHAVTGYLAASGNDWYFCLNELISSREKRLAIARAALHASLAAFGPVQRAAKWGRVHAQILGGSGAARAFALEVALKSRATSSPPVFPYETVFSSDKLDAAAVTVAIPLYNYEQYIVETLESVKAQTVSLLDLVIVDDASTDSSLAVALAWAKANAARFNRILVLKNQANYGLGFCRNSAFDAAETPFVLPLDADNKLRAECCEVLLEEIVASGAAYVYPTIQQFGASTDRIGCAPYEPQRFVFGNYIDAMALVAKEAWAVVGGYMHVRHGWEDYDFWCRLAEVGLVGRWCDQALAEYRVHSNSMLNSHTVLPENYKRLHQNFRQRHPWVSLVHEERFRKQPQADARVGAKGEWTRLDRLLQILQAPDGQRLVKEESGEFLLAVDGLSRWPIVQGRPVFVPEMIPEVRSENQITDTLPNNALDLIANTEGWVLQLSAGGSAQRFDHVVEVEYSISRNTDVVADAHILPFADDVFDAIVVLNAFEHYKEPARVAAELKRVLKPGGKLLVQTAFIQPLHERPWHFYKCTRHGMEEWFKGFDVDLVHVSANFAPNRSLAWLASEAEQALRSELSDEAGDLFKASTVGEVVEMWRDPARRNQAVWTNFEQLTQPTQEIMAAGFELTARKPRPTPDLR